jgi:ketosteroid isomerase-like protein
MADQDPAATAVAAAALSRRTREDAQRLYDAYRSGDLAGVLDALHDDVRWTSVAGPEVPWGGTCRGRAGVEAYFAAALGRISIQAYEIEHMIADGEWVTVLARVTATATATGRQEVFAKADVLRLREGRILEFREYCDTAQVLAWLGGGGREQPI